jgi:hypothetical protein
MVVAGNRHGKRAIIVSTGDVVLFHERFALLTCGAGVTDDVWIVPLKRCWVGLMTAHASWRPRAETPIRLLYASRAVWAVC